MDVVLIDPQIPQNTGSIARTCAATGTPLCLVGTLGFDISEKAVRRAGLDYWPYVELYQYQTFQEYCSARKPTALWYFSKFGDRPYYQARYGQADSIVFGSETRGLGEDFLKNCDRENILRIPIDCDGVRSLNLSNAVSIAVYEARRQWVLG